MAFDAFLTTAQAAAAMRRCSIEALRSQQAAYRAELAQAWAADDDNGIQHAGGRLALATHILERRAQAEGVAQYLGRSPAELEIRPIGDAPPIEDARGVIVGRGFVRDAGIDAGRRAAEIQLEDERQGDR